ncbi:MAG: (Fe-S)-binding protein [Evtepia sp.]|jgi:epoxyqueuosine reductase|nr:(Fe-S)-binding protein [Evtepia sp.]
MNAIWKAVGAAAWGAVSFDGLLPYLTAEMDGKIKTICPSPGGVWVAAFSYYAGRSPGNLALYCRGQDYHQVLKQRLDFVCAELRAKYPNHQFHPGADNSPIPEQICAILAGLGERGQHNLLIVPPYGSYVFLGTVLTDLPLETTSRQLPEICLCCTLCQKACPTGALELGFASERCLSHITQKKGVLSKEETELVAKSPTIWGCDICQNVCPLNQEALLSSVPQFREDLMTNLSEEELSVLTNRQFVAQYGNRAFSWRGPAPLRRNLELKRENAENHKF